MPFESVLGWFDHSVTILAKPLIAVSEPVEDCQFMKILNFLGSQTSEQVLNPDTYMQCSTFSGKSFGKECRFTVQYVLGNAYLKGFIGEKQVELFWQRNAGFQMSLIPMGGLLEQTDRALLSGASHCLDVIQSYMEKNI